MNPLPPLRMVFGREANTYAGADIELARRFARVLWPVGTLVMFAMVPFFPPTHKIGNWGWAFPAFAGICMVVNATIARRRPEVITFNVLYAAGFWGLFNIAVMQ